ncbi:hypothetical protein HDU76_006421 [Blyttiomyces sp. JEL0837]|nr:hypothetical protein HDU76_006421 [Blyttiomyces sp. JEL0837]
MGAQSTPVSESSILANTVLVPIYEDHSSAGFPIVASLPCTERYSDAWAVKYAIVKDDVPFNHYTDYATLEGSTSIYRNGAYLNSPIVPPMTTFGDLSNTDAALPSLKEAWFQNKVVYYADLGEIDRRVISNDNVRTNNEIDFVKNGKTVGTPIFDIAIDDVNYSGFYSLNTADVTGRNFKVDTIRVNQTIPTGFFNYTIPAGNVNFTMPASNYTIPPYVIPGPPTTTPPPPTTTGYNVPPPPPTTTAYKTTTTTLKKATTKKSTTTKSTTTVKKSSSSAAASAKYSIAASVSSAVNYYVYNPSTTTTSTQFVYVVPPPLPPVNGTNNTNGTMGGPGYATRSGAEGISIWRQVGSVGLIGPLVMIVLLAL